MAYQYENLMAERGYELMSHAADHSSFNYHKDTPYYGIACTVYPKDESFELMILAGTVRISSGRCSPVTNVAHFARMENDVLNTALYGALKGKDFNERQIEYVKRITQQRKEGLL